MFHRSWKLLLVVLLTDTAPAQDKPPVKQKERVAKPRVHG
jgi:hypothetical protein